MRVGLLIFTIFTTGAFETPAHAETPAWTSSESSTSPAVTDELASPATSAKACTPSYYTTSIVSDFYLYQRDAMVASDLNLDGKPDVVGTRYGEILVFLADGDGEFSAAPRPNVTFSAQLGLARLSNPVVRDFNRDGKPDIAFSADFESRIWVLLGDGTGRFTPAAPLLSFPNLNVRALAAADFNNDGIVDLVASHSLDAVSVLLGNGAGGFTTAPGSPMSGNQVLGERIAALDFNRDGNADIVIDAQIDASSPVVIRLGDGTGAFGAPIIVAIGYRSFPGDFNSDGFADLVIRVSPPAGGVAVYLGDGRGGFALASAPMLTGAAPLAVGDFDGDGKLDVLAQTASLAILLGDGLGGLTRGPSGIGPQGGFLTSFETAYSSAAVGDFNQDGRLEFTTFHNWLGLVTLVGKCEASPTTTTLVTSPAPSASGESVSLTASVTSSAVSGVPTGKVEFSIGGSVVRRIKDLVGGVASLTEAFTSTTFISARYLGDVAFETSSSAALHSVRPKLSITDPSANTFSDTAVQFVVSLSSATDVPVSVAYRTADRSARAGIDYTSTSGTLTFEAGQTAKTVAVPVSRGTAGPSKDFFLALSNPTNAVLGRSAGVGTLSYVDNPGALTLLIDDPVVREGNAGVTLLAFTLSLSKTASTVTVEFSTADGTATAGTDYTSRSGTVTFPAGKRVRTILIPIVGNTTVQSNRTVFVNLTNPTGGAQLVRTQGTGTVVDDDPNSAASGVAQMRLYSPATLEHLYTTDSNEYAVLGSMGWEQEGRAYTIFSDAGSVGGSFGIPVYRLYHPIIRQHHWTTDANEATVISADAWDYEGIAGYVLSTQEPGTVPLYRLMLSTPPLHLWTIDSNEKNVLSTQRGWTFEGILGYVIP
jgi:hypothetical protein